MFEMLYLQRTIPSFNILRNLRPDEELDSRIKAYCPLLGPEPVGEVPSLNGQSKGSYHVFTRHSKEITENSERLGRQARLFIEPGTSRLQALSAELLHHWRGETNEKASENFAEG